MDSLFLYRDQGNRRKQFIKANSDAIASQVSDKDGMLLSSIVLSDGGCPLSDEEEASFCDRGLIERKKDGTLKVTETGMKAVSFYPLFGRKCSRKPYPSAFFPMMLSIIASGELPEHHALYSKNLSSDLIAGRFTQIAKEDFSAAAVRTAEALDEMGFIRHDGGKLSMDRENAIRFFSLPLHDKLSYMIHPELDEENHRKLSKAIALIEHLSDYSEDDIGNLFRRIEAITGFDLSDDMEWLLRFSIIYIQDGRVSAYDTGRSTASDAVISSDFTITSDGTLKSPVFLFAEPLKADVSEQWAITRTSAKAAFSMGMTDKDIMKELKRISREALPEMIGGRISSWYGSFSALRCMRALVIISDDKNARVMDALPTFQVHVLAKPSSNVFLMNPETEEEWRKILRTAGFDMLGRTEGWELKEKALPPALEETASPLIPEERAVPFDAALRSDMIHKADSALMEALIESGFILSPDTEIPHVDMILGLYYQEKARLVASIEGRKAKLYAEKADGSVIIGRAVKSAEPGHVTVNGLDIDIAKIWKAAELPLSVRSIIKDGEPEDSDSL